MPLQNRVLATGEVIAHSARGLFMGNRGILHDDARRLDAARWRHKAWIICVLAWKDWRRDVMQPGNYTELFFLDEAVALAAGHRPCALCRRERFTAFKDAMGYQGSAPDLDNTLHAARAIPRRFEQRRIACPIDDLPDGAIFFDGQAKLVRGDAVLPVTASGYGTPQIRPKVRGVVVLTPRPTLTALKGGYRPVLHGSAG
jgi:hypothetical protein